MNPVTDTDAIVQEVIMHATAERIFDALTDPAQRIKWWGIEGRFQLKEFESDLCPGGKWAMRGTAMEGRPFLIQGEYREIERPHLLTFTWLPDWYEGATESLVRWDLTENNGVTTVRLTHSNLKTEAARTSHRGWPQILGWLQAYVEGV
jgi:uncharacterized protein YndB with AHSA1/START domain